MDPNWEDTYMPGPSGPPRRSRRPPGYSFTSPNDPSSSPEWVPLDVSRTEFRPLEPACFGFPEPPQLLPFPTPPLQQTHRYIAPPQQTLPTPSEEFQKYIDSLRPLAPSQEYQSPDIAMSLPDDFPLQSLDLELYSDVMMTFPDIVDDHIKMPLMDDAGPVAGPSQEFQQCPDIMMSLHVDAMPIPSISQEFQMYPDIDQNIPLVEYMKPFPAFMVPLVENLMALRDKMAVGVSSRDLLPSAEDVMPAPSSSMEPRGLHQRIPGSMLVIKSYSSRKTKPFTEEESSRSRDKDNPRESRNKAEKQRRDQLNGSITELASMVPSVLSARRRVDKTGVLRLTAHYLRTQQYIFGDAIEVSRDDFDLKLESVMALLQMFRGFLLTVTYTGLVVVVSPNVHEFLGHSEFDLLGQNIMSITHEDDQAMLREQLTPPAHFLGPRGELVLPDEPAARQAAQAELEGIQKKFTVRLRKNTPRSEAPQYVTCFVEGSLRKADHACDGNQRSGPKVRRARARADNPCTSGNDLVFIGMVRPSVDTFRREFEMESNVMEYRTRHSVDGEIIQCDRKISLVAGYLTGEVMGLNAMNFIHKDDVRWVAIALRDMYDQHRVMGESCYRLRMRNGQFVYMWSRGSLVVEPVTHDVTSFLCTNTVVGKAEGRALNREMKRKFYRMMNNNEEIPEDELKEDDSTIVTNHTPQRVEDPRQLKKVIFHMVTNLPSLDPSLDAPGCSTSSDQPRLSIIPPDRERISSSIDKIYSVINDFGNGIPSNSTSPDKPTDGGTDTEEDITPPKAKIAKYKEAKPVTPPKLQTFEEAFMNQKVEEKNQNGRFGYKVSDQVLGAVQLDAVGASGSCKRKIFETSLYNAANDVVEEMPAECYDANEFRSLLGNNGAEQSLFAQTSETIEQNQDDLPDVLLDPVFQELLNNLDKDQDIEAKDDDKDDGF